MIKSPIQSPIQTEESSFQVEVEVDLITRAGLCNMITHLCGTTASASVAAEVDKLFDLVETKRVGKMDHGEYLDFMNALELVFSQDLDVIADELTSATAIHEIFEKLDTDKNGSLSRSEVVDGASLLGITEEAAERVFDKLDVDGNGQIGLEEFTADSASGPIQEARATAAAELFKSSFDSAAPARAARRTTEQEPPAAQFLLKNPKALANWQVLYCGGAKPLVDTLKELKAKYCIKLSIEKFDW